jgi:hypothetical protein
MYSSYSFTTPAQDGGEWSASRPRFTPGETTPGTHWTRVWVGLRAGLDTEATGKNRLLLPGNEPGSPGHPVRSQTLYWLSYLRCSVEMNLFSHGRVCVCVWCSKASHNQKMWLLEDVGYIPGWERHSWALCNPEKRILSRPKQLDKEQTDFDKFEREEEKNVEPWHF